MGMVYEYEEIDGKAETFNRDEFLKDAHKVSQAVHELAKKYGDIYVNVFHCRDSNNTNFTSDNIFPLFVNDVMYLSLWYGNIDELTCKGWRKEE